MFNTIIIETVVAILTLHTEAGIGIDSHSDSNQLHTFLLVEALLFKLLSSIILDGSLSSLSTLVNFFITS